MRERKPIGEILKELGVLSPDEVDRVLTALRRRGDAAKFGQIAKELGLAREEHILAALTVQLELIPRASDLSLRHILDELCKPVKSQPRIPAASLRRHGVVNSPRLKP